MKFSKPNVLVIGNGKWAGTILKSLTGSKLDLDIDQIGARSFISNENQDILRNVSIIWIATLPQIQIDVLKKIHDAKLKVILEKPLARNVYELKTLSDVINISNNQIFLSALWNRNILWEKFLQENKIDLIDNIEIKRGGPLLRDSINPIIDWLPHDLYLLTELFGEIKEISSTTTANKKSANINIKYSCGVKVLVQVGYFKQGREAVWRVFDRNGNFRIIEFKHDPNQKPEDEAIPKMIKDIEQNASRVSVKLAIANYKAIFEALGNNFF